MGWEACSLSAGATLRRNSVMFDVGATEVLSLWFVLSDTDVTHSGHVLRVRWGGGAAGCRVGRGWGSVCGGYGGGIFIPLESGLFDTTPLVYQLRDLSPSFAWCLAVPPPPHCALVWWWWWSALTFRSNLINSDTLLHETSLYFLRLSQ